MNTGNWGGWLLLLTSAMVNTVQADIYDDMVERAAAAGGVGAQEQAEPASTSEDTPEDTPEDTVDKLYRVVDEQGKVSFTDVKPENAEATELSIDPELNVLGDKSSARLQYERQLNRQLDNKKRRRQQYRQSLQRAQERLTQAETAQREGELPLDSEWQRNINGGRTLKAAYYQRQQALQAAVEQARQQLQRLKTGRVE